MYDKYSISQRVKINLFNLLGNKRSHRSCCLNVFDLQLKPPHCRPAGRPAHVALYCRILDKLFSEAVGIHGCLLTCMEGNSFFVVVCFVLASCLWGVATAKKVCFPGAFNFCLHKSVSFALIICFLMPNIKKE